MWRFLSRKLRLGERFEQVLDGRVHSRVRVPLPSALLALVGGFLLGIGSVRGVEDRLRNAGGFRRLAGWNGPISDDTLREVLTRLDGSSLQGVLHDVGRRALGRWRAGRYLECELARRLAPLGAQGLCARAVVAIDGHETFCSEKLACAMCHTRHKTVGRGKDRRLVTERYHKLVAALWIGVHPALVLDVEPVRPGEGEQTASARLVERLGEVYGSLVGTVVADALSDHEPFRRAVRKAGFHSVVRHKDPRRQPGGDLEKQLSRRDPLREHPDGRHRSADGRLYEWWVEQEAGEGRRYVEVRRSGGGRASTRGGCVTDLPSARVPALAVGLVMETRWWIENTAFHELAGQLDFDRAFVHKGRETAAWAIVVLALLAYNAWQLYVYGELGLDAARPERTWGDLRRDLWESLHTLVRPGLSWTDVRGP